MLNSPHSKLSRRERQILDALYRLGRATAAEVMAAIPDAPGYSAIRATLRILEGKQHIRHEEENLRYVYLPIVSREKARQSAVRHVLDTFFEGSAEQVVATLLDVSSRNLSKKELDRLSKLIEKAKREGR